MELRLVILKMSESSILLAIRKYFHWSWVLSKISTNTDAFLQAYAKGINNCYFCPALFKIWILFLHVLVSYK